MSYDRLVRRWRASRWNRFKGHLERIEDDIYQRQSTAPDRSRASLQTLCAFSLLFCLLTAQAIAHPMGNFSINHYARFDFGAKQISLRYVLDMAEIPTITEIRAIDVDHNGAVSNGELAAYATPASRRLWSNIALQVNGRETTGRMTAAAAQLLPGASGLRTLRVTFIVSTPLSTFADKSVTVTYHDSNYAERTGWKEIVADAFGGLALQSSTAATTDRSHELTVYPTDPTLAPPQQTDAQMSLRLERGSNGSRAAADLDAAKRQVSSKALRPTGTRTPQDAFTQAISQRKLTMGVVLIALGLAFLFGALHALSPGHGKAMVAAYLVGSRGTVRHAVFLGAVITLTHTISVYILGLVTLAAAQIIVPDRLYPVLSIASGFTIAGVGLGMLYARIRDWREDAREGADCAWGEEAATPVLPSDAEVSMKSLAILGVTGGALPCPSALVVMLGAIALHRIAFGIALIGAFSLGLAAVLTGIGILVVRLRHVVDRLPLHERFTSRLPIVSAGLVTLVGSLIIVRALHGQF